MSTGEREEGRRKRENARPLPPPTHGLDPPTLSVRTRTPTSSDATPAAATTDRTPMLRQSASFNAEASPRGRSPHAAPLQYARRLTTLPLAALIFYEVSGGPFGIEDAVGAAGPALAIAGFCLLPSCGPSLRLSSPPNWPPRFPRMRATWPGSPPPLARWPGFRKGFGRGRRASQTMPSTPVLFTSYLEAAAPSAPGGVAQTRAYLHPGARGVGRQLPGPGRGGWRRGRRDRVCRGPLPRPHRSCRPPHSARQLAPAQTAVRSPVVCPLPTSCFGI